ncbi:hypothetical protein [Sulfobacillus harzensis]|uniref:Uncharacterized protein n=1 Tax=Sulfobacillus harzensis TaxID=2729629 RepID=A0A7Y0L4X2_9FIRM|nr:hypothetical protein [Sulfobacillus harzensis]NMP23032.1 hypothetical protein [Sulfobacillus harzensis]
MQQLIRVAPVAAIVLLAGCGTLSAVHPAAQTTASPTAKPPAPKTKGHKEPQRQKPTTVPANDTATTVTLLNGSHETVLSGPWPSWPASWDQPGRWSNGQPIPTVHGYAFGVPGTPAPQILPTVIPAGVSTHGLTAQVNQMGQIAAQAVISQYLGSISAYATDWKTNVTQNTGPYAGQPAQVALAKDANQWFGAMAGNHTKVYMFKVLPVYAGGLLSSDPTFEVYLEWVESNSLHPTPFIGAGGDVVTLQGNAITGMDAGQVAPTLNSPSVNYTPPAWWQSAENEIGQPAPHSLY